MMSTCWSPWSSAAAVVVAALMLGCRPSGRVQQGDDTSILETPSDPFSVLTVAVDGDSLRATVQYGGGCREHGFALEPMGVATKSLPRQWSLRLLHDAHEDLCRALISEDLAWDLTPYRDPQNAVVVLRLDVWPDPLTYRYTP